MMASSRDTWGMGYSLTSAIRRRTRMMPSRLHARDWRWSMPWLISRQISELQVRVGIATGMVVVGNCTGEGAAREQTVIGETPNLAARLQALAEPGTVLISESTHQLTDGHFEY